MPSAGEIYEGAYLSALTVKSRKLVGKPLTISDVQPQEVGSGKNQKTKLVVSFNEIDKQVVLNKTNSGTMIEAYGDDYTQWIGKKIFLQIIKQRFEGTLRDSISVGTESPTSTFKESSMCEHTYKTQEDGSIKCIYCGKVVKI